MLSRAGVVVESSSMLTCSYRLKATEQLHINREKEKTNKRRKRENKLYVQQRHNNMKWNYMPCNPGVLPNIFKIIFHFLYLENRFTNCALFQFPSYVKFYKFYWVVISTLTNTHQSSHFSFQNLVGTICRLSHRSSCRTLRRLVYSTPNREGLYTPLRNNQIIYLNRLKN